MRALKYLLGLAMTYLGVGAVIAIIDALVFNWKAATVNTSTGGSGTASATATMVLYDVFAWPYVIYTWIANPTMVFSPQVIAANGG